MIETDYTRLLLDTGNLMRELEKEAEATVIKRVQLCDTPMAAHLTSMRDFRTNGSKGVVRFKLNGVTHEFETTIDDMGNPINGAKGLAEQIATKVATLILTDKTAKHLWTETSGKAA